ncbi:MAG TPA: hypothetical protein RMG48_02720 [Myxococcales bacterium LLY-WYZ-16_1]|nr:hypothetical protein [Myxococcales bacterium LLY-WYZ-16_1]
MVGCGSASDGDGGSDAGRGEADAQLPDASSDPDLGIEDLGRRHDMAMDFADFVPGPAPPAVPSRCSRVCQQQAQGCVAECERGSESSLAGYAIYEADSGDELELPLGCSQDVGVFTVFMGTGYELREYACCCK